MDSGSAVPTISPGFNETVAAKLLTTARGRWSGALAGSPASSGCETVFPVGPSELMRIRCARFLAADNPTSGDSHKPACRCGALVQFWTSSDDPGGNSPAANRRDAQRYLFLVDRGKGSAEHLVDSRSEEHTSE